MPTIHFLNVGEGDCIIVQHGSGRVSMIDISCGNLELPRPTLGNLGFGLRAPSGLGVPAPNLLSAMNPARTDGSQGLAGLLAPAPGLGMVPAPNMAQRGITGLGMIGQAPAGNRAMGERPTKPQDYLRQLGIREIWRFVLTHPDMDHLDGFDALLREFTVHNFWHWGAEKEKPAFGGFSRYREGDWDRYARVKAGQDVVNARLVLAGDTFNYANQTDRPNDIGDGLHVLAPTAELVAAANASEDPNDGSYVILYRVGSFRVVFAGDSHDRTWEHIVANHRADIADCDVLIAPHHGRRSGRSWDFLNVLNPRLTLFGVARSEHLAYEAWNRRELFKITNNQAGNILIEASNTRLDVYVESDTLAHEHSPQDLVRHPIGYRRLGYLAAVQQ